MKLSTWIFLLVSTIVLIYVNLWYDHMQYVWNNQWWYDFTGVLGIIINVIFGFAVVIPAINWLDGEFGNTP